MALELLSIGLINLSRVHESSPQGSMRAVAHLLSAKTDLPIFISFEEVWWRNNKPNFGLFEKKRPPGALPV